MRFIQWMLLAALLFPWIARTEAAAPANKDRPAVPHSFQNPVYPEYLADPFCWRVGDTYYAIGTGREEGDGKKISGNVVPMIKSRDLQHWQSVGRVLIPAEEERGGCFWAPEVAVNDGTFYLYYHCNGERQGVPYPGRHQQKPGRPLPRHRQAAHRRHEKSLRHRLACLPRQRRPVVPVLRHRFPGQ